MIGLSPEQSQPLGGEWCHGASPHLLLWQGPCGQLLWNTPGLAGTVGGIRPVLGENMGQVFLEWHAETGLCPWPTDHYLASSTW